MTRPLLRRLSPPVLAALVATLALPATAQQQSASYKFLQAVRDAKADEVTKALEEPGSRIVDTRDVSSGEGAVHIVVKRGDITYLRYLLQRGANPDLRDGQGNTPLLLAVNGGQEPMIALLKAANANVNLANTRGETPLILAVQRRDLTMARELIADGADPDQTDTIAGMSARDYAHSDTRSTAMAKLIDETPKKARRAVSGPKL